MTAAPTANTGTTAPDANTATESVRPAHLYDVPGWLYNTDVILFDWFLERQRRTDRRGDLLEMGSYMGKSAVLMRAYLRDDETFTVCDLFDSEATDDANGKEVKGSYASLTRTAFEANFLAFHDELPRIIQAPTSVVPERVADGSCRFVHVDASHLYEHVHPDILAARGALGEGGIVVLDDYRSSHTPGVACATWQAVLQDGLRPVCVSPNKFYGTWGDPAPLQEELTRSLRERGKCWQQWQDVAGQRLLLVGAKNAQPPRLPRSRHSGTGPKRGPGPAPVRASSAARALAKDLLPPLVTRALRRARARRANA